MVSLVLWFSSSLLSAQAADGPALLRELEVTPHGFRASYDVELYIRRDGNLFLEDILVLDIDLAREVARVSAGRGTNARIVVAADAEADYKRVIEVLDLVQAGGIGRIALEVGNAVPAGDPLFPGTPTNTADAALFPGNLEDGLVNLDQTEYTARFADARPRRYKFPQHPYHSTDFTAYTREWGEAKFGLTSMSYGVAPRVQVGTVPVLDAIGVFNGHVKGNFLRIGPFDSALMGQVSFIPITSLLRAIDPDGTYNIGGYQVEDKEIFVDRLTYLSFTLQNSLQLVGGWSVHGGATYSRATARGNLDFYNLPVLTLPVLDSLGGQVQVVPSVVGELIDIRFATDYRFNRRDSIVMQVAETVYGSARGAVTANVEELPTAVAGVNNLDFVVRYDGMIPWYQSIRASLAWQFSWQRVDLRFGWGISAVPGTWALQAFDLSYRFGGTTRRTETTIRRNYKQDAEELQVIDGLQFSSPEDEEAELLEELEKLEELEDPKDP